MKPPAFDYAAPGSLDEALALLAAKGDGAKLLAGGQSFVPALNFRLARPEFIIDLNRVPGLAGIRRDRDGGLLIGAMTRVRAIERSEVVARSNPLLHSAIPWIAHVPIRNRGTIGGSLAHADPAAELPAIALACDAILVATGILGKRDIAARDFFLGVFTTALRAGEILTDIRFPVWPPNRRHGFAEFARRHGDFAIVGVAATIDVAADGAVGDARIVVFGAGDTPRRAREAEAALAGSHPDTGALQRAAALAANHVDPPSDHHASAEYRRELAGTLTRRVLEQALAPRARAA